MASLAEASHPLHHQNPPVLTISPAKLCPVLGHVRPLLPPPLSDWLFQLDSFHSRVFCNPVATVGLHMNHAFLFPIISDDSGREDYFSQGQPIPGDSKELTCGHTFQIQTNRSRAHTLTASSMGLTLWPLFPCPIHPKARCQTPRDSPTLQSPMKLFKVANPKSAHPASPIP